jgi:predicted GNAT superfamily acetyltransferase
VRDRIAGCSVAPPSSAAGDPVLNPAIVSKGGLLAPSDTFADPDQAFCLVEIPPDLNHLKSTAPDLALKWRWQTRAIFEQAFAAGYTAIDLIRREGRNFYLLQKGWVSPP